MRKPLGTMPYKGTAPAMTDLIGGQIDLMCDQSTNPTQQIEAKKVIAYAVTTAKPLTTTALKDPDFIKKQEGLGAVVVSDKRVEPAEHKKFVAKPGEAVGELNAPDDFSVRFVAAPHHLNEGHRAQFE